MLVSFWLTFLLQIFSENRFLLEILAVLAAKDINGLRYFWTVIEILYGLVSWKFAF